MSDLNRNYAIVTPEGYFLTYPNVEGAGRIIPLHTKEEAILKIKMYCPNGIIKKMKVKEGL